MARLSERIIRLALISVFVIGLIIFLSGSQPQPQTNKNPATKPSSSYHKSKSQAGNNLTPDQREQLKKLEDTQKEKINEEESNGQLASQMPDTSSFGGLAGDMDYVRENATFVSLVRNNELWDIADAIRSVEDRFNRNYHYDWVFLNEEEFTEEFKMVVTTLISGEVKFGLVPRDHWGYPEFIDQNKAAQTRVDMSDIIYGDSESYRHMCRYQSGFFFQEEVMKQYKYYWRVEPGTKLHCDVNFDVFKFMRENDKDYAFTITIKEFERTIPTLWETTKKFIDKNPQVLAPNNLMNFVSSDNGKTYNLCHYWTNFEVANMDFWRGEAYQKYFEYLDKSGGFFYERWGDAPVHSIAASLFLPADRVHFFEEIGYYHGPYNNCPINQELYTKNKCLCKQNDDFTWKDYSCTRRYFDVLGLEKPKGWEKHTG